MSVNAPYGSNNQFSPDLLVRQVLLEGLALLARDPVRSTMLYERFDDLVGGSQDEQPGSWRARLRELTQYGAEEALQIGVGHPHDAARLPYVGVVLDSGSEVASMARLNDLQAVSHEVIGEDVQNGDGSYDFGSQRVIQHRHRQTDWTSSIQVSTWATTPEESLLVHEAVREVLLNDKGRLRPAGITNVSFSDTGFAPDVQIRPRTGWVPVLSVSMEWDLTQVQRRRVPSRVTGTLTFAN